tara:strand:- start:370 stop:1173 length:804 start_codon:yes stop_codon:yes gene_type:complete
MARKLRLDLHLLTKEGVNSRNQAQQLIRAGKVRTVDGEILDKPGFEVYDDLELLVIPSPRFVSRGGEKLLAAFNAFQLKVDGRICLDGGISTGGFTDCLLQHGASRIYGIDVGYGQIAWSLRNDSKVVLKERTNLRHLTPELLYKPKDIWPNFAVADLSFISLKMVIPVITSLLRSEGKEALLLVKPQFEVGRNRVGKGGVVKDINAHIDALKGVMEVSTSEGWELQGLIPSPITGPAGNHEYLLWLGLEKKKDFPVLKTLVENTLN